MRIHKSQLPLVASTYVEQHVMPKATGWTKIACGAFAFLIHTRLDAMIADPKVEEMARYLQLVDDNGTVDMAYLRELATNAVKQTDGKFPPIMGYSLDSSDIETIYSIAGQYASVGV